MSLERVKQNSLLCAVGIHDIAMQHIFFCRRTWLRCASSSFLRLIYTHHTPLAPSTGQQKKIGSTQVPMATANGVMNASQFLGQCQPCLTLYRTALVIRKREMPTHAVNSNVHHSSDVTLIS